MPVSDAVQILDRDPRLVAFEYKCRGTPHDSLPEEIFTNVLPRRDPSPKGR